MKPFLRLKIEDSKVEASAMQEVPFPRSPEISDENKQFTP